MSDKIQWDYSSNQKNETVSENPLPEMMQKSSLGYYPLMLIVLMVLVVVAALLWNRMK